MNRKLKILLVEDDSLICKKFSDLLENSQSFELVEMTNNSSTAIDLINEFFPDIVILDLELHAGQGSGLDVLLGTKSLSLPKTPYFLVTTHNSSHITYETARQLGADYIMSKHQNDYSEQMVISFLNMISPTIKSNSQQHSPQITNEETPSFKEKNLTRRITSELNMIGISPKSMGYKYLIDAIQLVMDNNQHNICVIVAKKYNKTSSSVERAMQNAINRAWATSDINDLLTYYTAKINSDRGVPTLTEFIFYYANKLKTDY